MSLTVTHSPSLPLGGLSQGETACSSCPPPPPPSAHQGCHHQNRGQPRGRPGGPHIPPPGPGHGCFLPARGEPRCGDWSAARGRREPPPLLPGAASGVRGEGRRRQKQHRRAATPAELPPAHRDFAAPQRRPAACGAAQEAEADGRAGERCSAAARKPPGTVTMVCHPRRGAPGRAPRGAQLLLGPTRRSRPLPCHSTPPARGQDRGSRTLRSAPPHWSAWSPAPPPP